jgi:hypothetical protein
MPLLFGRGWAAHGAACTLKRSPVHARVARQRVIIAGSAHTIQTGMQVVRTWRTDRLATASPQELLATHGVSHLLYGGLALCGKLAGVAYARKSHLQREAALLGARLASAAFAGSLTHPQRAVDFAAYTPVAIREGSARGLFVDAHALSARDCAAGAQAIVAALLRAECALEALPVAALWEWLAERVLRDAAATVRARIARACALCDLGLLGAAYDTITLLMTGSGLPEPLSKGFVVHRLVEGGPYVPPDIPTFHPSKHPGDAANKAAIDFVCRGGVHAAIASHLRPPAVAELTLMRCRFLHGLGAVPCLWAKHNVHGEALQNGERPPEKVRYSHSNNSLMLVNCIFLFRWWYM